MALSFHTILSPSSDLFLPHDAKHPAPPAYLYYNQPCSLQIIQLVECPAPPPPAPVHPASESYYDSSDYSSSYDDDDDSDEDEDEEICSSYCSSDLPPEEFESSQSVGFDRPAAAVATGAGLPSSPSRLYPASSPSSTVQPPLKPAESDDIRMKRILAWREDFSAAMSATLSDSLLSNNNPLKRKYEDPCEDDDDTASHSSKRSRTSDGDESSLSSFGEHACPACDATFPSRQSLRRHGLDAAKFNEACSVAVEYAFE